MYFCFAPLKGVKKFLKADEIIGTEISAMVLVAFKKQGRSPGIHQYKVSSVSTVVLFLEVERVSYGGRTQLL